MSHVILKHAGPANPSFGMILTLQEESVKNTVYNSIVDNNDKDL